MDKEKGGGSRKSNKDNSTSNQLMAELMFNAQQQQQNQSNPITLLQQQMNAIMQQAGTALGNGNNQSQRDASSSSSSNSAAATASAYWYLEYLTRIQAAQMIPNLEGSSQSQEMKKTKGSGSKRPSSSSSMQRPLPPPLNASQKRRISTSSSKSPSPLPIKKAKHPNLPNLPLLPQPSLSMQIPPANPSSSNPNPKTPSPAHSTPINLSQKSDPSKRPKSPPPAHQSLPILYTHMIPKPPQLGMFHKKSEITSRKKKTVASLLAETKHHYRPWLKEEECRDDEEDIVIPSITITRKDTPDFTIPLKHGWFRITNIKSDFKSGDPFQGPVAYISPQGIRCKSIQEVKKFLNQRNELSIKHFTFNNSVTVGTFIFSFEGEKIELDWKDLSDGEDLMAKLRIKKEEMLLKKEEARLLNLQQEQERIDRERKRQHLLIVRSLENLKKSKRKLKIQQEKNKNNRKDEDLKENVKKGSFELLSKSDLKHLDKLRINLHPSAFSNLLQIHEFLNTFGETLGFDMDSLPDLESLLKGFLNEQENEEELQSILIHLIVCAVEDPGMPNPTKHLTEFNQTLKQADVNFGSLSEILRIYLESVSDEEPEADLLSDYLAEAPFTCHNPQRKTEIVKFLCDLLLQNKAVLRQLENTSELISNCKKERISNDVRIRKLRMVLARRAVAEVNKDEGESGEAVIPPIKEEEEDQEEDKLPIEELKAKINGLNTANEKLKKQISQNYKSIRTQCLGQDRYRRRYWNLPHSGGIYIEGGISSELEDLKEKVKAKFDRNEEDEDFNDENENPISNEEEEEEKKSFDLVVPPPVIKIFSFKKDSICTGKRLTAPKVKEEPQDDELLVRKIKREHWDSYFALKDETEIKEFSSGLAENGVRERDLRKGLEELNLVEIPGIFFYEDLDEEGEDEGKRDGSGVDPDLFYKVHLSLIEAIEGLEERVAGASLQVKNWTLPSPRNLHLLDSEEQLTQPEIITLVQDRLLNLEQAIERRYLKPPLGKSTIEIKLSNLLGGEDNVNALNNENMTGSTSSTRGQQIQENNKLREMKEKEEKLEAAVEKQGKESRFLLHWRDSILKTQSPSVLSMAIYLLDSSIAWDKSVMKACCQICKGGDHEDKLLLCDACDRGYHTYCFKPPLDQIPDGDWFCYECINKVTGNRGCIVCGKGNLQGKKLLQCDKCVKAFHTDCIVPVVNKIPRGRWYCADHQPNPSSSSSFQTQPPPSSSSSTSTKKPALPPHPPDISPKKTIKKRTNPSEAEISESSEPDTSSSSSPMKEPPPKKTKKQKRELEWCEKILQDLMGHEDAWPFMEPVNTRQFPTYKKIIKTPMDLSTIKGRLGTVYKGKGDFLGDVRIIFDNCETFNEDDSPVGKAGHNLRVYFESLTNSQSNSESNN